MNLLCSRLLAFARIENFLSVREDLWIYVALITPITLIALNDLGNKKVPHSIGWGAGLRVISR